MENINQSQKPNPPEEELDNWHNWRREHGWQYKKAEPKKPTTFSTAIIDDELTPEILPLLENEGMPTILIRPDRNRNLLKNEPSLTEKKNLIKGLIEILNNNHVVVAIIDLCLGIEQNISESIMEKLKEEGIKLIILSGAMVDPKGEIAQFADRILMKPVGVDKIIEAINEVMKNPKDRLD